jgi:hypothetical protein
LTAPHGDLRDVSQSTKNPNKRKNISGRDVSESIDKANKRKSVFGRMSSALKAHVSRLRGVRDALPEHIMRPLLRFGPERAPPNTKVRSSLQFINVPVAAILQSRIAASIYLRSGVGWAMAPTAAPTPTLEDFYGIFANSSSSADESRETTPSPHGYIENATGTSTPSQESSGEDSGASTTLHDSSSESSGEETDETSSYHSCEVDTQGRQELERRLQEKIEQNAALWRANNETTARLQQSEENYNALQAKHTKQLEQRQNDKNSVEQAFSSYEAAEDRSELLEEQVAMLQAENAALEMQYEAQLHAQTRQTTKLEADQRCANAVLENIHGKELAVKEVEIQHAISLLAKKDQELQEVFQKASDERKLYEKVSNNRLREVQKAAETNHKVLDEQNQALQHQTGRLEGHCRDAIDANEREMVCILRRNYQVEKEHQLMSQMVKQQYPDAGELNEVIDNNLAGLEDERNSRAQLKQLREQNENLLDKMQQMEGHYTKHQNAEQDARLEANHLRRQLLDCQDKIDLQNQQLRDAAEQWK